jgi:hypothetical protein
VDAIKLLEVTPFRKEKRKKYFLHLGFEPGTSDVNPTHY